ncbi:oxidoreductase domain protein [Catenulispora acidiphila DSM 44928]|uniref:Oxidoreductase domain protein n=1 Tax=Catenulispora acidiphila (strain DSM 44928 / JCM 14897 / NBRC 102108 / NRRL B-24433 / ID139908) TaxID=479433 RepID=C7QCJ0_CATAD|nr:Gfo/Idh/MocA family oxidoreductase [Catenulispora acidiphila]ACU76453.1 oxidoreductase domain protein [Catenulispora acidiphila DSM 44928]
MSGTSGTKLRAGLIGLGMMGRHHARVLGSLDGVELVAVADPGGDAHGAANGRPVLGGVEELIAAGIDFAVVAVPTVFHAETGLALAEAGVHTLIEKPLAPDVESATQLTETFERAGLVGAVGHIERFNPSLQNLRKRLEHGELGEVFQVVTRRQGPFPNRIADVGVVKDLATHDIDSTAWVTRQTYTSISAHTAYRSGREHEDLIAMTGRLADGTVVNHLVNWLSPMKERVTIVTGEKGCFVADTLTADLTFYANASAPTIPTWEAMQAFRGVSEGDMVRFAIPKPEPLRTELEAFRDAVLDVDGGRDRVVSMRQGLQVVRVAEAALDSAAKGTTVEL